MWKVLPTQFIDLAEGWDAKSVTICLCVDFTANHSNSIHTTKFANHFRKSVTFSHPAWIGLKAPTGRRERGIRRSRHLSKRVTSPDFGTGPIHTDGGIKRATLRCEELKFFPPLDLNRESLLLFFPTFSDELFGRGKGQSHRRRRAISSIGSRLIRFRISYAIFWLAKSINTSAVSGAAVFLVGKVFLGNRLGELWIRCSWNNKLN